MYRGEREVRGSRVRGDVQRWKRGERQSCERRCTEVKENVEKGNVQRWKRIYRKATYKGERECTERQSRKVKENVERGNVERWLALFVFSNLSTCMQRVVVGCSLLQCVAVWCSVISLWIRVACVNCVSDMYEVCEWSLCVCVCVCVCVCACVCLWVYLFVNLCGVCQMCEWCVWDMFLLGTKGVCVCVCVCVRVFDTHIVCAKQSQIPHTAHTHYNQQFDQRTRSSSVWLHLHTNTHTYKHTSIVSNNHIHLNTAHTHCTHTLHTHTAHISLRNVRETAVCDFTYTQTHTHTRTHICCTQKSNISLTMYTHCIHQSEECNTRTHMCCDNHISLAQPIHTVYTSLRKVREAAWVGYH